MNTLSQVVYPLSIANTDISMLDGLYSLNDLHKVAGGENKHRPSLFIANKETQELIAEIEQETSEARISASIKKTAIKVIKGGDVAKQGTYVCKELVYRYAMWISAKFTLMVIRAFDAMTNQQWLIRNQRKTISPEQQAVLQAIVKDKARDNRCAYQEIWSRHNRHFGIAKYSQLPAEFFLDSKTYLETMDLSFVPKKPSHITFDILDSETTGKVMNYYYALHQEIQRLGGKAPEYPQFDEETIVRAVVTRMVDTKRMLLTFDPRTGNPKVDFIPNKSWIVSSDNIVNIIGDREGVSKDLLKPIIEAAINRLAR